MDKREEFKAELNALWTALKKLAASLMWRTANAAATSAAVTAACAERLPERTTEQIEVTPLLQAPASQVNGSLLRLEEPDAVVYPQVCQEQCAAGETNRDRVNGPTVQEPVLGQGIPELQVVEQKLEQTVEAMEVNPLERVQRRAVEQSASLFERLEEFDKRLEMSDARRSENNELIKEIGGGAWSVVTRLVVWLMGWCCVVMRMFTKSPWTNCWHEERWWSSALVSRILVGNWLCGLVVWRHGQCDEIHFGRRPWTRPRQRFRHAQEMWQATPSKIPWTDSFGPALYSMKLTAILSIVFWSALLCIEFLGRSIWMWLTRVVSSPWLVLVKSNQALTLNFMVRLILWVSRSMMRLRIHAPPVIWSSPKKNKEGFTQKKEAEATRQKRHEKSKGAQKDNFWRQEGSKDKWDQWQKRWMTKRDKEKMGSRNKRWTKGRWRKKGNP